MNQTEELLAVLKYPSSVLAESYRGIRTSLQRALANDVKTIMFVSSYGGDGKSMVCANVAVALTQLFMDVILVDGDLRRPTLTNLFNRLDIPGLGDYLAGKAELNEVIHPTDIERLKIVPAGFVEENPGNLLGRPALANFCKNIGAQADAVIIDSSPVSACNDAISFGQHIDTTIMVISPKNWHGEVEVKIKQTLEQHKVPLMGVVLNGSSSKTDQYGGYGYGYGAAYGVRSAYSYGYGDSAPGSSERKPRSFWSKLKGLWGPGE